MGGVCRGGEGKEKDQALTTHVAHGIPRNGKVGWVDGEGERKD